MDQEQIAGNVAKNGLRRNWNPLLGSHFGGVFESLVKVVKKTLKAIVGNAGLTDDAAHCYQGSRSIDELETIDV